MRYWVDIKNKLKDHITLATQLLLLILGVYILIMGEENRRWKVPVLFIGLLSWFFFRNKIKHPIIWITFFALLAIDLYHAYFWVANHHFMLMFMVLSVLIYCYHKRTDVLLKNIQILLVVVLMASVMQKLMLSQFMSGNFYYYMLNRGFLFKHFINFFAESLEIAKSNRESILALKDTDPNIAQSIVLKNIFPNLGLICLIFAWATVAIEFMVAIALLLKPRSTWTHLLFIAMILGVLCTRSETGFMALLAISGVFLCNNLYLRFLYVVLVMGCIILVVTKLGFH